LVIDVVGEGILENLAIRQIRTDKQAMRVVPELSPLASAEDNKREERY
jgi:hypothetical protein